MIVVSTIIELPFGGLVVGRSRLDLCHNATMRENQNKKCERIRFRLFTLLR
jgi:hypothetical protein